MAIHDDSFVTQDMALAAMPSSEKRMANDRTDVGLLWLRITTSFLLLWTNGWPKVVHYTSELQHIDDPLGLGRTPTLWLALFSEVVCPLAVAIGCLTRLSCVPIIVLLLVTMIGVHGDWTMEQGQFGWLYLFVHVALLVMGPGRYSIDDRLFGPARVRMPGPERR